MNDIPLANLVAILLLLIAASAFFSGSETALMVVNRYRLKHRAKSGDRAARLAQALLERTDRLLGLILLCNTAVNLAAGSVATLIGLRLSGDIGAAIATGVVTFLLLIFSEVAPKTMAALHPERVALPAAYVYTLLERPLRPLVALVTLAGRGLLRIFGVSAEDAERHSLSVEELRSVVAEAGAMIPQRHRRMLLSILDLERATVEDIMVPRNEIYGLDLSAPWPQVREAIIASEHTRLPVYAGSIDQLRGVVHLRRLLTPAVEGKLDAAGLVSLLREPYFIPEGTPLHQQLLNFQDQRRRIGFVVDEYGDIHGLVTLEDILEEVVGEFTSDPATRTKHVFLDTDGSVLVHGTVTLRALNRSLGWKLPTSGPKTLNGLVLEQLEDMPAPGRRLRVGDYEIEISEVRANAVKTARVRWLRAPPRQPSLARAH